MPRYLQPTSGATQLLGIIELFLLQEKKSKEEKKHSTRLIGSFRLNSIGIFPFPPVLNGANALSNVSFHVVVPVIVSRRFVAFYLYLFIFGS